MRKYWRNKSDNYHGNLVFIGVFLLFAGKQEKYRSLDDGGAVLEYRFILKMQHIMVDNPTAKYEDPQFDPDGIITTENWGDTIVYKDRTYTLITDCTVLYLYQGE